PRVRRLFPPVIDENVDHVERYDVMPPERGYEDRITRLQFRDLRGGQRFPEFGEAFEIGILQRNHADGRTGGRPLDRADIEICNLFGREESESSLAADHAGDVVHLVEMRGRENSLPNHNLGSTDASRRGSLCSARKPGMQSMIGAHCNATEGGLAKWEYRAIW